MPAPIASVLKQLVSAKFIGFSLKVPSDFKMPTGEAASHFQKAWEGKVASVPAMPPLFAPVLPNNPTHVDIQKLAVKNFDKFITGMTSAIASAWAQWQSMAVMTGVLINGPTASVGQVVGPPLMPLILAGCVGFTPSEMKYAMAIANTLNTAWLAYTASIKLSGAPLYPAFAAFPSPLAPPMPSIPWPLASCTKVDASMQVNALKMMMIGNLADPTAPYHKELFEAVATGVNTAFTTWQSTTMLTNILGTGPVPTFAPPVVPAGPVVGGVGNMTPGGFV